MGGAGGALYTRGERVTARHPSSSRRRGGAGDAVAGACLAARARDVDGSLCAEQGVVRGALSCRASDARRLCKRADVLVGLPTQEANRDDGELAGRASAITTPFTADLELDLPRVEEHCSRMLNAAGCVGVIAVQYVVLGESATLTHDEGADRRGLAEAVGDRGSSCRRIASLSTDGLVELAVRAGQMGASGLMVLPPSRVFDGRADERAHFRQ